MKHIRLVTFYEAPNCWDFLDDDIEFECDAQLENYVLNNINETIDLPGFVVEDFTVPDDLDRSLILDICNGKSFTLWDSESVDFHSEMYQFWSFIQNGDKYEPFLHNQNET